MYLAEINASAPTNEVSQEFITMNIAAYYKRRGGAKLKFFLSYLVSKGLLQSEQEAQVTDFLNKYSVNKAEYPSFKRIKVLFGDIAKKIRLSRIVKLFQGLVSCNCLKMSSIKKPWNFIIRSMNKAKVSLEERFNVLIAGNEFLTIPKMAKKLKANEKDIETLITERKDIVRKALFVDKDFHRFYVSKQRKVGFQELVNAFRSAASTAL